MILLEVFVPMLNRGFDFQVDENGLVEDVTEEIAETVCQSQQCVLKGKYEDLILCKNSNHRILAAQMTLADAGICTGDRLILL